MQTKNRKAISLKTLAIKVTQDCTDEWDMAQTLKFGIKQGLNFGCEEIMKVTFQGLALGSDQGLMLIKSAVVSLHGGHLMLINLFYTKS